MAVRQSNKRYAVARTHVARSAAVPKPVPERVPNQRTRFLHVPASFGRDKPIEGREAAMTLMQAVHVVAHAARRGALSIRWTATTNLSGGGRSGE